MNRNLSLAVAVLATASVGFAEDAVKVEVGRKALDFAMTGIDGSEFKLSDKTGKNKNIVLMFSRANW